MAHHRIHRPAVTAKLRVLIPRHLPFVMYAAATVAAVSYIADMMVRVTA